MISQLRRRQALVKANDEFMNERGNSLPGYISFYAKFNISAQQAAKIYEADVAFRNHLLKDAALKR